MIDLRPLCLDNDLYARIFDTDPPWYIFDRERRILR